MNEAVLSFSPFREKFDSKIISFFFFLLFLFFNTTYLTAQATLQVTVVDGEATTTCSGSFGLPPVVQWSVNIDNQGEELYPLFANCFNSFPNVQYTGTFDCHYLLPSKLDVCFKAFENEALFCNINEQCTAEICAELAVPTLPGTTINHTLEIPDGMESDGFVNLRFELIDDFMGDSNDDPCTALDMGILEANNSLGSNNLSQYDNSCANLSGVGAEPAPGITTVIDNQGLWFQFQTGAEPIDLVSIAAWSDPQNLGDPVNLQLVLYQSQTGNCSSLQYLNSEYDPIDNDAFIYWNCLEPNSTYMILVDGTFNSTAGLEGVFDLEIRAEDITQAANFICDAENLGAVPDGSQVEAILRTNNCADNINDPSPAAFNLNQSVWFGFEAPPSGNVIISASNHLPQIGNELLDLQIALFETDDNTCTGLITEIASSFDNSSLNESLEVECLEAGQPYWVLIDGADDIIAGAFDIIISDGGNFPPEIDNPIVLCPNTSYTIGNNTYDLTGLYTDTLTASNGCDSIVHTDLSFSTEIIPNIMEVNPAMLETTLDGSATANPSGGSPSYSYQWDNGATTQSIENVMAGIYCVTISDELGCTAEDCVEIFFLGAVVPQISSDNLACFGDTNGLLTLSSTGGTPPYTFDWKNTTDDSTGSGTIANEGDSVNLENLTAGEYSITVSGSAGQMSTILTEITQPEAIETELNPILCFGESINIGNNTYDSDGSFQEMLQSSTGCDSLVFGVVSILEENIVQNPITICANESYEIGTSTYENSGMYEDILTDSNGCDSTVMTDLLVLETIELSINIDQLASGYQENDAEASVEIVGDSGNFIINWDNGETQNNVAGLQGGSTICVQVIDDIGCENSICELIPYSADNLAQLSSRDAECFGTNTGNLVLEAGLGLAPFTYEWENTLSGNTGNGTLADGEVLDIPNLAMGTYQLTISDANGVSSVLSSLIEEPAPLEINTLAIQNPTCLGECDAAFDLEVLGGMGDYTFVWSDNNLTNNIENNLCANDYFLTVTDANGCETTHVVSITEPAALTAIAEETSPVNCFEGNDGQATVNSNNSIATVLWDNGETTPTATQLSAGIHEVSITDSDGCMTTTTVNITEPSEPVSLLLTELEGVSCNGFSDALVVAEALGPGSVFDFQWSESVEGQTGNTSFLASNLAAGNYTVTISNESGCTAVQSIELSEPEALEFDFSTTDATCLNDGNSGTINVDNVIGGTNPYVYAIDGATFLTENNFESLPPDTYELTVQDVEGCMTAQEAVIVPPPSLDISINPNQQITLGESISLQPTVNSQNATFNWTSSDANFDCVDCPSIQVQPIVETNFVLEVIDSVTFCTNSIEFTVDVNVERDIYIPNAFSPNNDGINDFFLPKVGLGITQVQNMMIFDRTGNLVFQRSDFDPRDESLGWDGNFRGKDLPEGVYVFAMQIEYVDGEVISYKGDIAIIY